MRELLLAIFLCFCVQLVCCHDSHEESKGHQEILHDFELLESSSVSIVNPSKTKRSVFNKLNDRFYQPLDDTFELQMVVYDQLITFDLELDTYFLNPKLKIKKGKTNLPVTHRYYRGMASSSIGKGWARLTIHQNTETGNILVSGHFMQGEVLYTIEKTKRFLNKPPEFSEHAKRHFKRENMADVPMLVYRSSDVQLNFGASGHSFCGVDDEHSINFAEFGVQGFSGLNIQTHDHSMQHSKRAAAGCPADGDIQFLYIGLHTDCQYVTTVAREEDDVEEYLLETISLVSAIYETQLNVAVGVVQLEMAESCSDSEKPFVDDCIAYDIEDRLSDFSEWRGNYFDEFSAGTDEEKEENPGWDAALWHLMSDCPREGASSTTLGIAWLGLVCQTRGFEHQVSGKNQWVSGTGITTYQSTITWLVLAHELGHNVGARHDCTSTTCSGSSCASNPCSCCECSGCDCDGEFIMNPSADDSVSEFSDCTVEEVCYTLGSRGCLEPPGSRIVIGGNQCGNGVWEIVNGEDCDCGNNETCAGNPCCNPDCTFKGNAECSDSNTACCDNCQIITASSASDIVCRAIPEGDQCDVAEYCIPGDPVCPDDAVKENGSNCTREGLFEPYCASGICTNREQQCIDVGINFERPQFRTDCKSKISLCYLFCESLLEGCALFPGYFIIGTKCGASGQGECFEEGVCSLDGFFQWAQQNIFLVMTLALIFCLLVAGFMWWGCKRSTRKEMTVSIKNAKLRMQQRSAPKRQPPPARSS
eukprot:Lithocolla_globosa_v1_NODE_1679_length_2402_cov_28.696634.p1 type:complete len:760 gc:universal NODE_1679_length_2402_cov_28.696634:47-2326(+)